jgi:hypothetical protein
MIPTINMDDQRTQTSMPIDRQTCPHCAPFQIRLVEVSRRLDELELKVERKQARRSRVGLNKMPLTKEK